MAQYTIRQKYFALKDKFAINDIYGEPKFYCDTKLVTIPKKFWLQTAGGKKLFMARFRPFSIRGRVDIYRGEDKSDGISAIIKQKLFCPIRKKLYVRSERYGDYFIKGGIIGDWGFKIYEGDSDDGKLVATISKRVLKIADTYDIYIDSRYEAFMLLLCVVLDAKYHKKH